MSDCDQEDKTLQTAVPNFSICWCCFFSTWEGAGGGSPVTPSLLKTQPEEERSVKPHPEISSWERAKEQKATQQGTANQRWHPLAAGGHPIPPHPPVHRLFVTSACCATRLGHIYHQWVWYGPSFPSYTLTPAAFCDGICTTATCCSQAVSPHNLPYSLGVGRRRVQPC